MSPVIALGLRLAWGSSRTERLRAGLVAGACVLGTLLLLAVLAVARTETLASGGRPDPEDRILYAAIAATVGLPVLMLLATVTRLSASIRDRRLAALRLLGLAPGLTRTVAAVEAGVLALAGMVVGTTAYYAAWPFAGHLIRFGRDSTAAGITPTLWQVLAVVVGVPLVAVLVSLAPTRAVTARPLAVRRSAPSGRPSLLRLLPVFAGAVLLATMFRAPQDPATSGNPSTLWPFLAGAVLAGLGLPVVVPVLVRTVADLLARATMRPAVLVAARRLQLEPASTTRLVAGLLLAVFVVTGARCVLTAWERTPQYVEAHHAAFVGPQVITIRDVGEGKPVDLSVLRDEPAVQKVVPADIVESNCDDPSEVCASAYVGTCAELRQLVAVEGCRDDQVAWLRPSTAPAEESPPAAPGTPVALGPEGPGRIEVRAPSAEVTWSAALESAYQFLLTANLFVPRSVPGASDLVQGGAATYVIFADPGKENQQAVLDAARPLLPDGYGFNAADYSALEQVDNYRHILWTVTAVVVLVGLTAFGVAAVDRATERRREVASLHILGAQVTLARTSQLFQALIPLGSGIPLAAGLGLLAGTGYLAFGGIRAYAPWPSVVTIAVAAMVAAVLVAAATVPALGRAVDPRMLRRE